MDKYDHILFDNDALEHLTNLTSKLDSDISDMASDIVIARDDHIITRNDISVAFYSVLQSTLDKCDYIPHHKQ